MKIAVMIGTRPEIIKLSRILFELDKYTELIIIHTGQNYNFTLNEIFFNEMEIRTPDYFLSVVGKNLGETIGNIISKSYDILQKINPDALLIYGDTNSCLSAYSAKRLKIPIFHMEAGNRCHNKQVPEEINRKIIDHISDINMVHSEHARHYLISEGIDPQLIIKTGSPMKEVLTYYNDRIKNSDILTKLNLTEKEYFVLSTHREENVDNEKNLLTLFDSINKVAEHYNRRIIFSCHPRTQKKINEIKLNLLIEIMEPIGFFDYCKLQQNALCVLSDSGTITEESTILGFPAIMLRKEHERPEGEGNIIMSGLESENIIDSINISVNQKLPKSINDYNVDNVSQQVVKIIVSYTEYINRVVWKKDVQ